MSILWSCRRMVFLLAAVALPLLPACHRGRPPIDTPEEFVSEYAAAYRARDVDRICSMWADLRELETRAELQRPFRRAVDRRAVKLMRQALEQGLATDRLLYRAWGGAVYRSHREHEDHVHVTVEVMGVRTEIVLVRQDGSLRLHPQPSWFEGEEEEGGDLDLDPGSRRAHLRRNGSRHRLGRLGPASSAGTTGAAPMEPSAVVDDSVCDGVGACVDPGRVA